jgi:hypothetical protein
MMKMISPILMILCGVLAALGIWFPRLRAHWKGTRIPCGPLSCSGFALLFIGGGVVFLVIDSISEGDRIYFGFPAIVGFILAATGYAIDTRANSGSSVGMPATPSPRRGGSHGEQRIWIFAVFGILFFLMFLWIVILHK